MTIAWVVLGVLFVLAGFIAIVIEDPRALIAWLFGCWGVVLLALVAIEARTDRLCTALLNESETAADSLAVYTEFNECRIERP